MDGVLFGDSECGLSYLISNSWTLDRNSCLELTLRMEARKFSTSS